MRYIMFGEKGISNIGALLLLLAVVAIISMITYLGVAIAQAGVEVQVP